MIVASIDVGIVNLAVVIVELDDFTRDISRICYLANVDSTVFEHGSISLSACTLGHAKTTADRVTHFVQERQHMFDACAHVLIERQPLVGHTDVEQVLFLLFRQKAQLVSPNAMHKFFNISRYSYESRKVKTVMLADQYLPVKDFPLYHNLARKHDIADALCLLMFWIQQQKQPMTWRPTSKRESLSGRASVFTDNGVAVTMDVKSGDGDDTREHVGLNITKPCDGNENTVVAENSDEPLCTDGDDQLGDALPRFGELMQRYRFSPVTAPLHKRRTPTK